MTAVGYGAWAKNGAIFRAPNDTTIGPIESLDAIKARPDYGYVLFDPKTGDWRAERSHCRMIGLAFGPWTRIMSQADLTTLHDAHTLWTGSDRIGVNIEIGSGDGHGDTRDLALMRQALLLMSAVGRAILITDGWADPIGAWTGYKKWVGSVECFPEEFRPYRDVPGCLLHASAFFRATVPMLGAYGTSWLGRKPLRADYAVPDGSPYIVYTADDVEDWAKW